MSDLTLPDAWIKIPLREISKKITDGTHQPPKFQSSGIPFLVIGNIVKGSINWTSVKKWVSEETYNELTARTRPERGDILYTAVGSYGTAVAVHDDRPFSFQRHIAHIKPDGQAISQDFLAYWLNSPSARERADTVARGVAQKTVTLGDLAEFEIPLPPLSEQRRIVDKIEALTTRSRRAREALDTLPALIDRYRQSILAAAFRGDLTAEWRQKYPAADANHRIDEIIELRARATAISRKEKNIEDPSRPSVPLGDLPSSWGVTRLETLTDPTRKIQYGILMPGPDIADGVPYVKVMNMKGDQIDIKSLKRTSPEIHQQFSRASLRNRDILLSIRGTYGRVAIVPEELDGGNITQDTVRIAPLSIVNTDYVALFLRSPAAQKYFEMVSKGVAVRGVNVGDIRPMEVPFPPPDEQIEIVRQLNASLRIIDSVAQQVRPASDRLSALNQSILAKAFRGELVPQDPNDEPASVLLERIRAEREAAGEKPHRGRRSKGA
jgi:type I restriction enzyme S subunit